MRVYKSWFNVRSFGCVNQSRVPIPKSILDHSSILKTIFAIDAVGKSIDHNLETAMESCLILYNTMIEKGVAPEQARMVLPQSMMTEWYWSGTVYAFARVCNLRCAKDTQKETQDVTWKIHELADEAFPYCWKYLRM